MERFCYNRTNERFFCKRKEGKILLYEKGRKDSSVRERNELVSWKKKKLKILLAKKEIKVFL